MPEMWIWKWPKAYKAGYSQCRYESLWKDRARGRVHGGVPMAADLFLLGNGLEVVFHFASQQVYQRQMSVPDQEMCMHFQWRFHGFQDNLYVGPVLLCLFAIAGKR